MDESAASWYPNSICFEDKSKIKLRNDWWDSNFEGFFLSIDFDTDPSATFHCSYFVTGFLFILYLITTVLQTHTVLW